MLEKIQNRMVDDMHCAWRWATTWLNAFGTIIVTYALAHESVVTTLIPFLPAQFKPYAPIIGVLWGVLVQGARMYKQKEPARGQ